MGVASGFAREGFYPVFYSIAPFVVERCLEQIKIDIGYQNLPVSIVSIGASYDYAALGCTHHCPADMALIKTIPNITALAPGSDSEVDTLFKEAFGKTPVYMRLSEKGHSLNVPVSLGSASKIKSGKKGTVIVVGTLLERVVDACKYIDVSIVYYTTLSPFDREMCCCTGHVAIVEPFYKGTITHEIIDSCVIGATILQIGVPRKFLTNYGTVEEHDKACRLDAESLKIDLTDFFNGR